MFRMSKTVGNLEVKIGMVSRTFLEVLLFLFNFSSVFFDLLAAILLSFSSIFRFPLLKWLSLVHRFH